MAFALSHGSPKTDVLTNRHASPETGSVTHLRELTKTHKEEQTLVLPDGSAAAEEAQEEEHTSHGQDDVDASEQQGVGSDYFSEPRGVHQHPHPHSQEERAPQLKGRNERLQLGRTEVGYI